MGRIATVKEAHALITGMNFDIVKNFLVTRYEYTMDQVTELEEEYRRFMAICAVHASKENPLPISSAVDPFWHAHILHTKQYVEMSKELGSNYLHHVPAAGDDLIALEPGYNQMLNLYQNNFGAPNEKFWPAFGQICTGSACACSGPGND